MSLLVGTRDALDDTSIPMVAQTLLSEGSSQRRYIEIERQSFALPLICVIVMLRNVINVSLATHTEWLATLLTSGSQAWFPCHTSIYNDSLTTLPITAKGTLCSIAYYLLVAAACYVGGLLGDSVLGRYRTLRYALEALVVGFALQTILVLLTYFSVGERIGSGRWVFLVVEYAMLLTSGVLCAVGSGMQAANLLPFLTEQVSHHEFDQQWVYTGRVFHLFYFLGTLGCLFSNFVLATLQQTAYLVSVTVPLLLSLVSLSLLFIGRNRFVINRPQLNVYPHVTALLKEGWRLSKVLGVRDTGERHFLDYAGSPLGGSFSTAAVEAVKRLLTIARVTLLFFAYYVLYAVADCTFYVQGLFVKTPDSLTYQTSETVDDCAVIFTIPLFLFLIYPWIRARGTTLLPVLMIGFSVATLSITLGGVFEASRVAVVPFTGEKRDLTFYNVTFTVTQALHYYERVPQYLLLGVSEVLVAVPALQVIYRASPRQYRSISNGLLEGAKAMAVVLVSASLLITQIASFYTGTHWICQDLNRAKLYWYLYLVAISALSAMGLAACFSSKIEAIFTEIDAF